MNDETLLALALDWIEAEIGEGDALGHLFANTRRRGFDAAAGGIVAPFTDGPGRIVIQLGDAVPRFGSRPLIVTIEDEGFDGEIVRAIPAYVFEGCWGGSAA